MEPTTLATRSILRLGLDVHKETVVSAVLPDDAPTPRQIDTVPHDLARLKRYLDRLARDGAEIRCVYEASGSGYVLQRAIEGWGYHCDVCAPSLTPKRSGHQRKHNRYDAKELAAFDAVVLDPPRAGAQEQVRELAASSVARIAYVSCNPATFARDAEILAKGGYGLNWARPVGQFRWSTHVELAAAFSR